MNNSDFSPNQTIEQGRFAYVWAAHDGNGGKLLRGVGHFAERWVSLLCRMRMAFDLQLAHAIGDVNDS